MQRTKECYLCRKKAEELGYYGELTDKGLHKHHVIFGTGYRKHSEKYGLWVYLCYKHHNSGSKESVHRNNEINVELRQQAERVFLKDHTIEEWMEIFTSNYLEENELKRIKTEEEDTSKWEEAENKPETDNKVNTKRMMTKEPPPGFWFIE